MKFLFVVVGLVLSVAAEEPIAFNYHEEIGIPEAARIKRAEEAQDFDGSRIVGGQPSSLGEHPYLGGLVIPLNDGRTSVCGSSLVSPTRLVTAAHCWWAGNQQALQFTIVLGSNYIFSGGVRIVTTDVQMHPNYNKWNPNNDIAIIRTPVINYSNIIRPIAIATGNNSFAGVWAVAAGYGRTTDSNTEPFSVKRHATLQVMTNAACVKVFGPDAILPSTLCTSTTNGQSICGGDTGGPLAIGSGNNRTLIGIGSFGSARGCTRGFPVAFTRVTSFASWIKSLL